MSGEPWNEMMPAGAATEDREPWEPVRRPKKKGLMIGIAAAVVILAVAAVLVFPQPSADQMLADYDGVLYRLKIRSGELAQEARENERLLLKLLEDIKR